MAGSGIGWKESTTGQVTTVPSEEFTSVTWMRVARGQQLCIGLKNGTEVKFDGFPQDALEEVGNFCQTNYGLSVKPVEMSLKGHNWGKVEVNEEKKALEFRVGDKMAFSLNLRDGLSNVFQSAKDEVAIEFGQSEASKRLDCLSEIRFFVPSASMAGKKDEDEELDELLEGEKENSDEAGEEQSQAEQQDAAAKLFESIKAVSNIDQITGEILFSLPEMPCIVPRGRYAMDLATTYVRLYGKSYSYKIPYQQIVKLFMVPKADDLHILLVLALDPPIRQGQTRYPFIVFQFDKDEVIDAEEGLEVQNLTEAEVESKWEGKLKIKYSGPTFEVVSSLFRTLAGQKILVPSPSYKGIGGSACIKCAIKATEGYMYPLERNFLFLPKPPTLLPHADISNVEFSRLSAGLGNSRTFDMKFYLRSGTSFAFSNVSKEDYQGLEAFLLLKEIPFSKLVDESASAIGRRDAADDLGSSKRLRTMADLAEDDSEDDEDYQEGEESSEADYSGSDDSSVAEGDEDSEEEDEEEDEE